MGKPLATGPKMSTPSNIPDTDKPRPLGINPYSKDLDSPESPDLSVSTPPPKSAYHTNKLQGGSLVFGRCGFLCYIIQHSLTLSHGFHAGNHQSWQPSRDYEGRKLMVNTPTEKGRGEVCGGNRVLDLQNWGAGRCEAASMGAENQAQVLRKSSKRS